jgi:hypothetical protein
MWSFFPTLNQFNLVLVLEKNNFTYRQKCPVEDLTQSEYQ